MSSDKQLKRPKLAKLAAANSPVIHIGADAEGLHMLAVKSTRWSHRYGALIFFILMPIFRFAAVRIKEGWIPVVGDGKFRMACACLTAAEIVLITENDCADSAVLAKYSVSVCSEQGREASGGCLELHHVTNLRHA